MSGRRELVVLNPFQVALEGRVELNLHQGAILIRQEGPDWGDTEVEAFSAKGHLGQITVDVDMPNRVITIPIALGLEGDFDEARIALEAEVGRINEEGGWLKREIIGGSYGEAGERLYADIVKATLSLSDDTKVASQGFDDDAELILETLPDFYGEWLEEPAFSGGASGARTTMQIKGTMPGRVKLEVIEKSGVDLLGLSYCFRCRHYSAKNSAKWLYEAEDLTPLDTSTIAIGKGGASKTIFHDKVGTSWTPVLGLNPLPRVRSIGTVASGVIVPLAPPLPIGWQKDDIFVMYIETQNEAVTVPAGWAQVTGSPVEVASGTTTRLTVLWRRATAEESAPTIAATGNHAIAQIIAVTGCIRSGNPWNATKTETELVADTSVSIPGPTTTIDGCLILAAVATGTDVPEDALEGLANASLPDISQIIGSWTVSGGGGGFAVISGTKLKAGAVSATTATIANADFKALHAMALKPETGGNFLTHEGVYDVWARAYATSERPTWLRLIHDVGDLIAPEANDPVQIPGVERSYWLPLGQATLKRSPAGEHRWQGAIQSRGETGAEGVYIDKIKFDCADESSGVISAAPTSLELGLASFAARSEFATEAGAVTGDSPIVGTAWTELAGSDATDFNAESGALLRTAVSDTGTIKPYIGRAVGIECGLGAVGAAVDMQMSAHIASTEMGFLFRVNTAANFHFATLLALTEGMLLRVGRVMSGGVVGSRFINQPGINLLTARRFEVFCVGSLLRVFLDGQELATWSLFPGGVTTGGVYLLDQAESATAVTRTFRNFAAWPLTTDAVIFANQKALLTSDGMYRSGRDGVGYGPVGYPAADLPRVPVSGPEGRPVELAIMPNRGDFQQIPDELNNLIEPKFAYRPCWAGIPET
jgi:hypothetical protein